MNNRIRKYFCLFFVLAFFLVSCTQKSNDSASIKKMSGEIKLEAEISKLIQEDGDVNKVDERGIANLTWAVEFYYADAVKMLLENGASLNLKNRFGETALFLAKKRKEEPFNQEVRNRRKGFNPGSDYDRTIEILMEYGAK